jgi:hypothetical protein
VCKQQNKEAQVTDASNNSDDSVDFIYCTYRLDSAVLLVRSQTQWVLLNRVAHQPVTSQQTGHLPQGVGSDPCGGDFTPWMFTVFRFLVTLSRIACDSFLWGNIALLQCVSYTYQREPLYGVERVNNVSETLDNIQRGFLPTAEILR